MEISLINSSTIPHKDNLTTILRRKVKEFQDVKNGSKKDAIMIILNKNENYKGLETAWRRLCQIEYRKTPHVRVKPHELGKTIWLWWD